MKEQIKTMFWQWFSNEPLSIVSVKLTFITILFVLLIAGAIIQVIG